MQPNAHVAARRHPSRLQVALAAIWMTISLAIGGVVGAGSAGDTAGTSSNISRTTQP